MGITGGDPLMKLNRTIEYIKAVKQEFGKDFHIHLYCPMELVSDESLKKLYEAGLDEIRFHLDIENKINWNKLDIARKFRWKIGIEIPVVPGKEDNYIGIISFIKGEVDFLNLNELEVSDSEVCKLADKGFEPKNDFSYAIKASLLPQLRGIISLPFYHLPHAFDGQHYWELGTSGISERKFRDLLLHSRFNVLFDMRLQANPYHHFYLLQSKRYGK